MWYSTNFKKHTNSQSSANGGDRIDTFGLNDSHEDNDDDGRTLIMSMIQYVSTFSINCNNNTQKQQQSVSDRYCAKK